MASDDEMDRDEERTGTGEAQVGQATTARPRQVEATRSVVLVVPPEPTEEQIEKREECIDETHRAPGPPLRRTRNRGVEPPDVPPTGVGEPD